ncbi:flagellar hook-associated protein FlgK [Neokomagataea tanensis NBRC 106556]|uniref:Flagellar hook-associated protein 1 n=1 Tax=Neokomagataea tanensis NBRC 106556 TaxID=1223519 RepID=A0ABQ0QH44_9PROT|nr:flagellar hook-associated protein FlgK [Neokomagataea tanensis NBRC 106556]
MNNALSIASTGLSAVQYAMSVSSQNTANASTAGYIAEQPTVMASASGSGVIIAGTRLTVNTQVQSALYAQNSDVSYENTKQNSLSIISSLQGSTSSDPGASGTLSDLLGNVRSSLLSLSSSISSSAAQSTVVSSSNNLVQMLNGLSSGIQQQRQNAQDGVVSSVQDINTNLTTIGALSSKIMTLKTAGKDTADLENQRFTALNSLANDINISWKVSSNGDMSISTADGLALPTRMAPPSGQGVVSNNFPLMTSNAAVSVSSWYPGQGNKNALPGIMLNGVDITQSLKGGSVGANIELRDNILPVMQAQSDSFAYSLASRFQAQGMPLFTDSSGYVPNADQTNLPPQGSLGFAQSIRVSAQYQMTPSLLGADMTGGVLKNVLSNTFGSSLASAPSEGLGASGALRTGYSGQNDIIGLATALTSDQAAQAADASSNLSLAKTTQTSLASQFSSTSGVSVDKEMANVVALQNAYSANAKVISAVQTMFTSLLSAIGG